MCDRREPVAAGWWHESQRRGAKSDLRSHQAIVQPRLYDCLMVTQITPSLGAFGRHFVTPRPGKSPYVHTHHHTTNIRHPRVRLLHEQPWVPFPAPSTATRQIAVRNRQRVRPSWAGLPVQLVVNHPLAPTPDQGVATQKSRIIHPPDFDRYT